MVKDKLLGRPHRRAYFVTEPTAARSMALHHMILNTEVEKSTQAAAIPDAIWCDLRKLDECDFIQWCRQYPECVSEPLWFGLITNLAHLKGGPELIHQISALDNSRYNYPNTERLIQRVINTGYKPVSCMTLIEIAMTCPARRRFRCHKIGRCHFKAPVYLTTLHTVYERRGDVRWKKL